MDAPHPGLESLPALASHTHDLLVGIGPFVAGLVVVIGLIAAVAYGIRLRKSGEHRRSGPDATRPEEPKGYETSHRVPDEVPRDGRRRMPYEFKDYDSDSHPGEHERPRRKWDEGSSGSFGSGGPGRT
jgi:hypothetical protein